MTQFKKPNLKNWISVKEQLPEKDIPLEVANTPNNYYCFREAYYDGEHFIGTEGIIYPKYWRRKNYKLEIK